MPGEYDEILAALSAPFEPWEVKARAAQGGRQLLYVTARTVMNRLDTVLGIDGWWDEYVPGANSVLCRLSIRLPDGLVVTKCDAGGYAGMADQGDDDKSGYSDAFKRAAAKFGVMRYLYNDGVPGAVRERLGWDGRPLTAPTAQANGDRERSAPPRGRWGSGQPAAGGGSNGGPAGGSDGPPRSGRGLFAWVKDQEQRHEVGLLKYLNTWAKLQEYPGRMVDWDAEQVARAHAEALRKLDQLVRTGEVDEAMAN